MKVVTVIGARPQFIKAAPVSRIFQEKGIEEIVVHTGQHYDSNMSDIFFKELEMEPPKHHLGIGSKSHGAQTGEMLEQIEKVLVDEKPEALLVYGDTNSTLAGALAASKIHIPVVHVEAGLRSFNKKMPEEINRILTDHVSEILFTPTEVANRNLQAEGFKTDNIIYCGDVMYDVALFAKEKAKNGSKILSQLGLEPGKFILSTIHRAENTDIKERLVNIFEGLNKVSENQKVVLPLHPRTKAKLESYGLGSESFSKIKFIEPVGYIDMVALESNAALIATDSGGVQKEAFFYGIPCVTLRDETEWVELVEGGWNTLVTPVSGSEVASVVQSRLGSKGKDIAPYGSGKAAVKIAEELVKRFGR